MSTSPNYRRYPFCGWELIGRILYPTRCTLQRYAILSSTKGSLLTLRFADGASTTIRRSLLSSPPLKALSSLPFIESTTSNIQFQETEPSFRPLLDFMKCKPVDIANNAAETALIADRWGCTIIFEACLLYAEQAALDGCFASTFYRWMPVISVVSVTERFRSMFALHFARCVDCVIALLSSPPECSSSISEVLRHSNVYCGAWKATPSLGKRQRKSKKDCKWIWQGRCLWRIFYEKGLLMNIVRYMARFSEEDHSPLLLYVLTGRLNLPDTEFEKLFHELDLTSADLAKALRQLKCATEEKSWRSITLSFFRRHEGTDVRAGICIPSFAVLREKTSVQRVVTPFGMKLSLTLRGSDLFRAPHQTPPGALICVIKLHEDNSEALTSYASRSVSIRVDFVEENCVCETQVLGNRQFRGRLAKLCPVLNPDRIRCVDAERLSLLSLTQGHGIAFRLMSEDQAAIWKDSHEECGVFIRVRITIDAANKESTENGAELLDDVHNTSSTEQEPFEKYCSCYGCDHLQNIDEKRLQAVHTS